MREAVIVATARTPIGKAYRGAFNDTQAQTLGGHAIASALKRASVEPGEVDDVVMGAALQQGSQGGNVARQCALRAGLPASVAGMSVDRQCASGLMAIATAAKEIVDDGMSVAIGGGLESISLVQNDKMNRYRAQDPWLVEHRDDLYMTMIETAEIVAERYQVTRRKTGRVCVAIAAKNRGGASRRPLRRRDRALPTRDEGRRQGDRGRLGQAGQFEAGRRRARRHDLGWPRGAEAGVGRRAAGQGGLVHHRGQRFATVRRGQRLRVDGGQARQPAQPRAARDLSRHCGRRLRSRRDGHRPGLRRAEASQGAWPQGRRHRPLGAERGLRGAGDLLPRPARHRQRQAQCRWRRDRGRPPLWHERLAPHRPRADRGQEARRDAMWW